jgi:hypothetical protein
MRNQKIPFDIHTRVLVAGACILWFLASSVVDLNARERDGMPSERRARWPLYLGQRLNEEQVIVKSLRTQEDRLYVNEEPFVLTHQTSFVDERGRRLRPGSLWVGWLVELHYRTGEKSESHAYGPDQKVLVRMRVLERLQAPLEGDR